MITKQAPKKSFFGVYTEKARILKKFFFQIFPNEYWESYRFKNVDFLTCANFLNLHTTDDKYKTSRSFKPVNYAVFIDIYFVLGLVLESKTSRRV